ncbi:MAG: MMPL family transporter [Chloroflexi bacterium]|nr:MMPL family transporter [Chloroflexota bacterium]
MQKEDRSKRVAGWLERHSGWIIVGAAVITLSLIVPLLTMAPEGQASQDPGGEVFELRDDIDERFAASVHAAAFIAESPTGDILTQGALWELYLNTRRLLEADGRGELAPEALPSQPYLYSSFDLDTNRPIVGVTTIADAVQAVFLKDPALAPSLDLATDEQVKVAVHRVLSNPKTAGLADSLSVKARGDRRVVQGREIVWWTSPALVFPVLADNEKLGGGTLSIAVGGGDVVEDKEEFNRNVQRRLRGGEQNYRLWGIAIDLNLESADEGQVAGTFIMFTVVAAVLVVGLSLRSYWAMALTGAGLGVLMIWLKGITALVGIEGGLIIELIVPIAMISLGVDFAVHALRRYQEERALGYTPGRALRIGLGGVMGALVLAMFSDSIAFLSNTSSGIEQVIHFGVAAAIAVASSFIVLGVVAPLAMSRIDRLRDASRRSPSRIGRINTVVNGMGVAALSGAGVIFLVAVSPIAGLAVIGATVAGFVGVPVMVLRRRRPSPDDRAGEPGLVAETIQQDAQRTSLVEGAVGFLARFAPVVLLATAGVTAAAVVLALRLEPTFDPRDFLDNSSDFVVSLDKLDEHVSERSGEPGIIYIKGDLTDPAALSAVQRFADGLSENPYVARDATGQVDIRTNVLSLLRQITESDYARGQVEKATSIEITDSDGDGFPDSREQLRATYDYIQEHGVPLDRETLMFDPGQVRAVLFHDPSGIEEDVATLTVGIPDSREQATVASARLELNASMAPLRDSPSITRVGVTGSPFAREAQLDATTRTLQKSLPIAAVGTFVLLLLVMRSARYAVVTIVPVGLVVAWLYGLMYLMGFSLNYVTATIGAISIGIGIDYSIHMTERFREELQRASDKMGALRQAARGTGIALVGSAASSIIGFAIMGFAPMPLFASYGILTSIMIFLALVSSLAVLPSLLLMVTPEGAAQKASAGPGQQGTSTASCG